MVLPLLKLAVVSSGWTHTSTFLSDYGAAPTVPGPLSSIGVFFGERLLGGHGDAGTLVVLIAIFLRGFLLMTGVLRFWKTSSTPAVLSSVWPTLDIQNLEPNDNSFPKHWHRPPKAPNSLRCRAIEPLA